MAQPDPTTDVPQRGLRAIEAKFTGRQPKGRIKLVIHVGGRPLVSQNFNRGARVFLDGTWSYAESEPLVISVWRRRWFIYRRLYARVNVQPDECNSSPINLFGESDPTCVSHSPDAIMSTLATDPTGKVEFTLTFSDTSTDDPAPADGPVDLVEDAGKRRNEDKQALLAARKRVKDKKVILDKLGKARALVGFIKTFGDAVGDAHPAAGLAFTALGKLIEACEKQEQCRDCVLDLVDQLDEFLNIGARVPELDERADATEPVRNLLKLVNEIATYITEHTAVGVSSDLISDAYLEKIKTFTAHFQAALRVFERTLGVEAYKLLNTMYQDSKLERLNPALNAPYRASTAKMCLDGTRTALLDKLAAWRAATATDSTDERVPSLHWLCGAAGTGKSTVAKTFAKREKDRGTRVVGFFCQRDIAELSNPRRLLPTLSYTLAKQHPGYGRAIVKTLVDPDYEGIASDNLQEQFAVLFRRLLPVLHPSRDVFVFIIEALDECGSARDQETIAQHLLELGDSLPWIKVLVTSRKEPLLVLKFTESVCKVTDIAQEADTTEDIRHYIMHQLCILDIPVEKHSSITSSLVSRGAGLFIWYSTLFKFLETSVDRETVLKGISSAPSLASDGVYADLYQLYDQVLSAKIHTVEMSFARDVLGLIYISSDTRPLSCDGIAFFLGRDSAAPVRNVVQAMHAVLYEEEPVSGRQDGAVRVYHNSYRDYLHSHLTAPKTSEWRSVLAVHACIAKRALNTLIGELKFNICGLKGRPVLNKDIPDLDAVIAANISPQLQYSSLFWFHHLSASDLPTAATQDTVGMLLCKVRVFFYLEVLSLLDALEHGADIFFGCARYFKNVPVIVAASAEVERLVLAFSEAMKSAPHVYLSAVSWAPTERNLAQLSRRFTHLPLISSDNDASWDSCIAVRSMGSDVNSVAYCPDGSRFIVGLSDGTLRIADARTGAPIGEPLRGHPRSVLSVAWSPDGTWIASGSADQTVRLWNAHSGAPLGEPFRGHCGWVQCVAFSPDGTRVVSGSNDNALRVWDVPSGEPVGDLLQGHSEAVLAVVYSPDGTTIASGSYDNTIRMWNAELGDAIGQPLAGHSNSVRSVSYSPCGTRIVSASDDRTLRIWDAQSGEPIGNPLKGHSKLVSSAAFSPNGALLASCGRDTSVRLWDAKSHAPLAAFQEHSLAINSLTFSPDSLRLISGSNDGTVRIWNTSSRNVISDSAQGHSGTVTSVAYSADGTKIVSALRDATIRVWDARSGAPVGEPFRGHSEAVWAVAISPDNTRIVSGSNDNTLRIWELQSGTPIGDPLQGHTKSILCVAYSPDGAHIASGSSDNTIRIWNAKSGEPIGVPWQGPSGTVWSVAYSPNGQHIVSGSRDKTVRIWDAQSGTPIGDPLTGHSGNVNAVAYSPDGARIVSASDDETLRIWDAESGAPIGSPLQGHSHSVRSVAYAPDGKHIVSGGDDGKIRIWDAASGERVGEPLQAHFDWVHSVAYSPDGTCILSGSYDKTILGRSGPRLKSLAGYDFFVD